MLIRQLLSQTTDLNSPFPSTRNSEYQMFARKKKFLTKSTLDLSQLSSIDKIRNRDRDVNKENRNVGSSSSIKCSDRNNKSYGGLPF